MTNGYFPGALQAARHTKGHGGGVSACDLPSDFMSAEEIRKLSGEVKTVKLRPGMKWAEFCAMSETMQRAYLDAMMEHGAHSSHLAQMFGVTPGTVGFRMDALGYPKNGKGRSSQAKFREDDVRWRAWVEKCRAEKETEVEKLAEKQYTISTAVTKIEPAPIVGVWRGRLCYKGTAKDLSEQLARILPSGDLEIMVEYEVKS